MKINQLKAGVILSYLSMGLGAIVSIAYTPAMLRLLGQSEYGIYTLAGSVISYLGMLNLGFGSSYVRYYSKYKVNNDEDGLAKLNGMYMTLFVIIGLVAIIAGGILTFFCEEMFAKNLSTDEIRTTKILMALLTFNMALSFPFSVFSSYITANEKYLFQKTLAVIKVIVNPMLTLPALLMGFKSVGVVVMTVFINITIEIIHMLFCLKKLKMRFSFKSFDFKLFKNMAVFSSFIFINIVVNQVNWNVDKFLLGIFCGSVSVAIYGVAAQLNTYYQMFSTTISNVFIPKVHRIVSTTNSRKELTELFIKVGRIQFFVLLLVATGLVFFGKQFLIFWAGPEYVDAYPILLLLVLPVTIPLTQNIGIEVQRAQNQHRFRSIVYLMIAAINIIVTIILCPKYGGVGCVIGTAFAFVLGNGLIMNIYYHKKCNIDIIAFWKSIFSASKGLIIPVIFGFALINLLNTETILGMCVGILLYTLVYCISMWLLGMNQFERDLIIKPIKKT